jgi:hypothetical protein
MGVVGLALADMANGEAFGSILGVATAAREALGPAISTC